MKFSDILALAKQGYTPSDIRDLMALQTDENNQQEQTHTEPSSEDQESHIDVVPNNEPQEVDKMSGNGVDATAEKIQALEAEIKRLHEENKRIARPAIEKPEKSNQEILNDLARKFM